MYSNNTIYRYYSRLLYWIPSHQLKRLTSDCPAPPQGGAGLTVVINYRWAACLEHNGDLPQIPSPQETQRHGFSYLVAAHNPL